ncbi:MAG: L-histidine N(alpha)-methyltransferase [Vicinamibacterales bacterium]
MSTQAFVARETARLEARQFAGDVEYYLALTPRQLPSRYFYDALGSALFEAICQLPWYGVTRAERRLLTAHSAAIVAALDPLATLVELGPGSGEKLGILVDHVVHAQPGGSLTVHLVDVSPAALAAARSTLGPRAGLDVVTHQATYEDGLEALRQTSRRIAAPGRTLVVFLGSNIGNFDPPGADEFLRTIRAALTAGDALLLGADLVKPARDLILAYDDPLGVTAAFNRNLLVRVNRELGGDFDVDGFVHRAVWNAEALRVEMHLVSARGQRVRVPASQLDITFEPGETIWTESSYKYRPEGVLDMLTRTGFTSLAQWTDEAGGFALSLVQAV